MKTLWGINKLTAYFENPDMFKKENLNIYPKDKTDWTELKSFILHNRITAALHWVHNEEE